MENRKEEGNSPIADPAQTREQPNPQTLLPAQTVSPGKLHAQAQSLPATSFPQPSGPASEVQQPSAPARPEAQHRGPFSLHASASKPPRPSGARTARSRTPLVSRPQPQLVRVASPLAARPDPRVRVISFPAPSARTASSRNKPAVIPGRDSRSPSSLSRTPRSSARAL